MFNTAACRPVAGKQILNTRQWTGGKAMLSARSTTMAAHATMDTATEELCFLCCLCLDVSSRIIVEYSVVK
jgi:hypothetical protein